MEYDTAFLLQIAVHPDVVVANEIVHLHACIGQFGEFPEETRVSFRSNILVFCPEIEHVAKEIYGGSFVLYLVEEAHKATLLSALVLLCPGTKVCVGEEVGGFQVTDLRFKPRRQRQGRV